MKKLLQYIRGWLIDVPNSTSIFASYLYTHKEDVLVWVKKEIKILLNDSELAKNLGYTQIGYALFKRSLDDDTKHPDK